MPELPMVSSVKTMIDQGLVARIARNLSLLLQTVGVASTIDPKDRAIGEDGFNVIESIDLDEPTNEQVFRVGLSIAAHAYKSNRVVFSGLMRPKCGEVVTCTSINIIVSACAVERRIEPGITKRIDLLFKPVEE